jgi:hypothetical protein
MATVFKADTEQERKKALILGVLEQLMQEVESDRCFGEFGIVFTCQNGKIHQIEEKRNRTYK